MKSSGHHHDYNIRVLYYDEPTPKLRLGGATDDVLWNVITLCYHEYFEELEGMKKNLAGSGHLIAPYFNNCINFALNEMAPFCNSHKVPNPRPSKKGEMMPLPIDEYPIWFNNLEDFIADLTWGNKDRNIMMREVLPKMLNEFVVYKDVVEPTDFSSKSSLEIESAVSDVISRFPDKVKSYRNGKTGLLNMLFGEVMKITGGKINAKEAKLILESRLSSE